VSSSKDQKFMLENLQTTRKEQEQHEKWFSEGVKEEGNKLKK